MYPLTLILAAPSIACALSFIMMYLLVLPSNKASRHNLKLKASDATSSIIMRRFMMQDSENDPFVGFWVQADEHDELIDIGAWTGFE